MMKSDERSEDTTPIPLSQHLKPRYQIKLLTACRPNAGAMRIR